MNIAAHRRSAPTPSKKVENGHFPNEEAVVEEALRLFLVEAPTMDGTAP